MDEKNYDKFFLKKEKNHSATNLLFTLDEEISLIILNYKIVGMCTHLTYGPQYSDLVCMVSLALIFF